MRLLKEKEIINANVKIDFFTSLFSSFFFTGYFPKASGTVGSLAALFIFLIKIFHNPVVLAVLIFVTFIAGIYSSKIMMKRYGDDPSVVVIDEAVGMWVSVLIFILLSSSELSLFYTGICFFAFRFFDITKIQPAKYFDNLNSGFGIMMDDAAAGIYAGIAAYLISLIF